MLEKRREKKAALEEASAVRAKEEQGTWSWDGPKEVGLKGYLGY